ncbi:UbiA prenyltransferase family protein [Filimonas lacunae]|uniref:UbiA prenyltransferase family protein n=1 Tax=Filimonas lacunae TaxID=477680 RepID=A0A173MG20_9BACT|nr:hypothetical protein [Filimonas lacunae]BAV06572.1 hypothetical protein FLA_2591 [Filimonas lacunae]SIT27435.1 UbiA prenyltransferase family protein [Filimonas lacunae]
MRKNLIEYILFGNFFYGVCATALSIEAAYQLQIPLNHPFFYVILFSASVVYYTYAYIHEKYINPFNKRSVWYGTHKKTVGYSQTIFCVLAVVGCVYLLGRYFRGFAVIPVGQWMVALLFPLVAAFYYDLPVLRVLSLNLRKTGWMKPFVIGFVWAGVVTIYPILWKEVEEGKVYPFVLMTGWLALKNWMYITVLCIMFDIKDYASDSNNQLKTFVVRVGLRKTIFNIIIPITIAGLFSLLLFSAYMHFKPLRVVLNILPFLLMIIVAYSLHQRRNIMYYLAVIDGMMLIKAVCGVLAAILVH